MTSARTIVFDLDGTLVDTAPDLINALNFVLGREGLPPVPLLSARNMIGAGARRLIERGLELEGRSLGLDDVTRLMGDFIDYYAAHIADVSRPFDGLEDALDDLWQTIARAGGELSSSIMVGDAGPDIGVARRAGIPVICVEFGYTEVPIADLKPDRLINHMRELPAAVESLMLQRNPT